MMITQLTKIKKKNKLTSYINQLIIDLKIN
jgi:hypothetical protein